MADLDFGIGCLVFLGRIGCVQPSAGFFTIKYTGFGQKECEGLFYTSDLGENTCILVNGLPGGWLLSLEFTKLNFSLLWEYFLSLFLYCPSSLQ